MRLFLIFSLLAISNLKCSSVNDQKTFKKNQLHSNKFKLVSDFENNKNVIELDSDSFYNVKDSSEYLVLEFYATWCSSCKRLSPIYKELSNKYLGRYVFAKTNAEENSSLARSFQIKYFPTLIFFKNGKEIGRHTGFSNKSNLEKKINEFFN